MAIYSLSDAYKLGIEKLGGKAFRLSQLINKGFAVKNGYVLDIYETKLFIEGKLERNYFDFLDTSKMYAIRSSVVGEDSLNYSYAGQFVTILNVPFDKLIEGITSVTKESSKIITYIKKSDYNNGQELKLAIIIQEMVISQYAGVAFTINPLNGADEIIIEGTSGLADSLVSGKITPSRFVVRGEIVTQLHDNGSEISEKLILEVANITNNIKKFYSDDQDVEWAFSEQDDTLYIIQTRPVTAVYRDFVGYNRNEPKVILSGTSACPGKVLGKTLIISDSPLNAISNLQQNSVLVAKETDPSFMPLLLALKLKKGGIATQTGGILSHASIISRELNIPTIVGIENIFSLIENDMLVELDANQGILTISK